MVRLSNEHMIEAIFASDFAKEWKKEHEKDQKEDLEFYGRELTEDELKQYLLDNFFEQSLKDIVAVLPVLWKAIQEEVKDTLEDKVLISPEDLEENTSSRGSFHEYVTVDFSLNEYLGGIQSDLTKILKQTVKEKKRG